VTGVLHVITGLGSGGAETMLAQVAIALQDQGLEQHVVSLTGGGDHADALRDAGVAVTALNVGSAVSLPFGLARLAWLARRERPRVIQGWMYHGNVAAAAVHAASRRPTKLMWNIRASNMDEARYGRIIRWNARLSRRPDIVLTNSHASLDFHYERGLKPRMIMVVHNGIDTGKYRPDDNQRAAMRKELGIRDDAVVAAMVARVDPMKDHALFLEALAETPEVTGLLVGAGTEELSLPENAIALGLRHDVERVHNAADLIVSSSAYGEGFSNALAEGMSAGLIPVATDVGDAKLIVGDTGRIVPPSSAEMLSAAMAAEAALPRSARRNRGLAARQRVLDNYTLKKAVQTYAGLYA